MLISKQPASIAENRIQWQRWQSHLSAQHLVSLEQSLIDPLLKKAFGHQLLQISISGAQPLYQNACVPNKTILHFDLPVAGLGHAIVSEPDALAIANESIDVLILHHVLEFSNNPHQVLREAQRVLSSGGHLILVGFNPWSLWGLRRSLYLSRKAPWSGHYLSHRRVSDWMRLLGLNPASTQFAHFHYPLDNARVIESSGWLERSGQKYNLFFGGVYVVAARKQVFGMMPLHSRMRRRRIIPFPVTEPTTRSIETSDG